ncbi:ABC transporter permease [Hoeflea prorocentri]|uniref:ABC transporter permease subunit n=1 Tax=Hoeflea prorocentri TaxID=1922333 RepID=A0A9X3ZFL1_9HYPH|nr:ABC transporter permease subunit [Hoeflea prorocentri]MCY6379812.1 ABC transporter permease subunit [Hoeflea prorocentri]MDA5397612.1 ABC transporter permease subunit [Hoeflea prorocentri]
MSDRVKIVLLLAPAMIIIGVLFFGGLVIGLMRSFSYMPIIGLTEPNFDAYISIFTSREFYLSFLLTFYIAFVSTFISSVLAIGAALLLRRQFIGRAIVNFLFQLNLTVPHLVGAIGILYLFSQSGSFARLAAEWGMIARPSEFPALVFDPYAIGIILQYVWKEIPFIGVIVLANMQALGEDYESVARSLGANRWQAFIHVLLPLIFPGVLSASVIVFAFIFGAYEIPALLGANYPAALPVLAYRKYTDVDLAARPEAMAMAIVIALLSAVMIFLYVRYARRRVRS